MVPGQPQTVRSTADLPLVPKGYYQITNLGAAITLADALAAIDEDYVVPADAAAVLLQAEAQAIRWRDDGEDPEGGVGMLLADGADLYYTGDLSALRVIEEVAGAILNVSFYGYS